VLRVLGLFFVLVYGRGLVGLCRRGELAHGDGLLRGYLLLPAHLVPKKRYLVAEDGDKLRLVG
jgi:hypothetical protein